MRPQFIAYVVTNSNGGPDSRAIWREIGTVWPHRDGNGFDLVI